MADSNAIKAGAAYVELMTRNNTAPGIQQANKDIAQFGATATAKLTDAAKAGMVATDAMNKAAGDTKKVTSDLSQWANGLVKVTAAIWVVKQAYHSMMEKATEVIDAQVKRANELGDAWRKALGKDNERREFQTNLGGPANQFRATKTALDALDLPAKAKQLNDARAALDSYNKKNAWIKTEDGVVLANRSDNPFGFGNFNKGEKAQLESNLEQAEKNFKQASEAAEKYREKLRGLSDPSQNKELVTGIDSATKALQNQLVTLGMTPGQADLAIKKLDGANDAVLRLQSTWTKAFEEGQFRQGLKDLTREWDTQRHVIGKTAEMAELYARRMDYLKNHPGSEAFVDSELAGAVASGKALAAARVRETARQQMEDINEAQADALRERALTAVTASSKGGFGRALGSGSFEFGGGGQWQSEMVNALKEARDFDRRREKVEADMLKELKRIDSDTAQ